MSRATIPYPPKEGELMLSMGRNGSIRTSGAYLEAWPEALRIAPITGKGNVGNCYVDMAPAVLPEIVEAMLRLHLENHPEDAARMRAAVESGMAGVREIDPEDADVLAAAPGL